MKWAELQILFWPGLLIFGYYPACGVTLLFVQDRAKKLVYIAPYLIQAALLAPLAIYTTHVRPPLKEELLLGGFILAYFVGCVVLLLPISIWHGIAIWKSVSGKSERMVLLAFALGNLAVSYLMPGIVWEILGFKR